MPRSTYTDMLGSDTEFIEELITQHKTKQGVHIKKTWTAGTKHPPTKEENASGSRSKTKKKAQASHVMFGLHVIRRYIGLHHFLCILSPHTEAHVRYDLVVLPCTIRSCCSFVYDIYLGVTTTTILSIGGVQIPIDLVSSATDSIRQHVVLFKTMSVLTSDLKCYDSFLFALLHADTSDCFFPFSPILS